MEGAREHLDAINIDPLDAFHNQALPLVPSSENPPALAEEPVPTQYLDDVDRMVCHEDFPLLLALAAKVKGMRESMTQEAPSPGVQHMDPGQVLGAVDRIQARFMFKGQVNSVVIKGMYPLTDSMMDESFHILQKELERCEAWYDLKKKARTAHSKRRTTGDDEAIAVKYSKWQTDILMDWMIAHKHHPFPDQEQTKELGDRTGLSQSQIINWTTNVRKRNMKATVEGGKKPHHFVDFLFLAQDRDRRQAQGLDPPTTATPRKHKAPTPRNTPTRGAMTPPYSTPIYGTPGPTSMPYPQAAFRPYTGRTVYYSPSPHAGMPSPHASMSGPHMMQPGYHPYYQHPFPPPSHGHHAMPPLEEDEWDRKLRVVSESFDEDIPDPVTSAAEENARALDTFAQFWKYDDEGTLELMEEGMVPSSSVKQEEGTFQHDDAMMQADHATRQRGESLGSLELIDLDDEDFELKGIMKV
jgi:hypothetical protein